MISPIKESLCHREREEQRRKLAHSNYIGQRMQLLIGKTYEAQKLQRWHVFVEHVSDTCTHPTGIEHKSY